jgi:RNA polymerase sigma-70 factor (ECF subfamily)
MVGIGTAGAADAEDPGAVVAGKESVRLAFVAALQFLTPQQRAVLLLREVLAWRAAEIADTLGTSEAAVNSLLQRARAELSRVDPRLDALKEPSSARMRAVLDRYTAAFEAYDLAGMVAAFTDDTVWEMPPYAGWYAGAEAVGRLIATNCPANAPGDMRLVPTSANGQPAFGLYMRGEDGVHRAFQLQVLTVSEDDAGRDGVSHAAVFFAEGLFDRFGLPAVWAPPGQAGTS